MMFRRSQAIFELLRVRHVTEAVDALTALGAVLDVVTRGRGIASALNAPHAGLTLARRVTAAAPTLLAAPLARVRAGARRCSRELRGAFVLLVAALGRLLSGQRR